jgi:DNA repair protein RecN (Recombination protein N)
LLARKHRVPVLELPAQLIRVEAELRELRDSSSALSEREAQLNQLIKQYQDAAAALSAARRPAAAELSAQIAALMQSLGMAGGRFAIELSSAPSNFSVHGADEVDFLVSANPGQPLKPLAKVASGGELSRISLAIQVAAAARNSPLCMVFDEVDAGVGGAVAEIVGKQLRQLGSRAQVLCVTHLPQVASQAHRQFRVTKLTDGKTTRTTLSALNEDERVEEIARMLGGVDVTDKAREHAREMLAGSSAQTPKKQRARRATT